MPRSASPILSIPLVKGIDESADAKVQPYAFSALTNLRYARPGELVPRDPVKQESTVATRVRRLLPTQGSVAALVESSDTADSDLLLYHRNDVTETWSAETGKEGSRGDSGVTTQYVPLLSDARRAVVSGSAVAPSFAHSVAVYGGYRMHVVGAGPNVVARLFYGDKLMSEHTYSAVVRPRVFSILDGATQKWVIVSVLSSTQELAMAVSTGPAVSSWGTMTAITAAPVLLAAYLAYDMVFSGTRFYYVSSADTSEIVWNSGTIAAGVDNTNAIAAATVTPDSIAISADGAVAAWNDSTSTNTIAAVVNTATGDTIVAATTIFTGLTLKYLAIGGSWSSVYALIFASRTTTAGTTPDATVAQARVATFNKTTGAVGSLTLGTFYGWQIASQTVAVAGREYMLVKAETDGNPTDVGMQRLLVVQWDATTKYPFPILAGEAFVAAGDTYYEHARPVYVDGRIYFAGLEYSDDREYTKAVMYSATVNGTHLAPYANDGEANTLVVGGGLPVTVDDAGSVENVPLVYPAIVAAAGVGTGITGTVTYIAVYEIADAHGRLGWSAPSPATTPLVLANQSALIAVPQLWLTRQIATEDPRVKLYRSTNSGPYYLVDTWSLTRTTTGVTVLGDTTADLSANAMLYSDGTEGSEAERFCPPASSALAYYRGRMWSASDRRVYFSQPLDSEFMPQWSDVFYMEMPARVTGLAVVRSALIVFCDDPPSIYAIAGDGPDRANISGAYGLPELISSSVGCPSDLGGERSIVVVGSNVFFRSQRGIEVLNAAGQTQIVSHPIRNTLAGTSIVLDVAYWPERDESVWLLSDGSTGRKVAVLNHAMNVWTTFAGSLTADGLTADALAVYSDKLFTGLPSDGLWASSLSVHADTKGATEVGITTTMALSVRPFGAAGRGYLDAIHVNGTSAGDVLLALTQSTDGTTPVTTQTTKLEALFPVGADLALERDSIVPRGTAWSWSLDAIGQLHESTWRETPTWHSVGFDVRPLPGSRRPAEKDWM